MSFNTALSGLQAASIDLNVTSNNIANVATTGFKYSRTEFSDIYASNPYGNSSTAVGSGVQVDSVSQQFNQGNFDFTDGSLDLAISGQGFFVVSGEQSGGGDLSYTRAGEFLVNGDGYIINSDGNFLQAFPVDPNTEQVTSTSLNSASSILLPVATGAPQASTDINIGINLESTAGFLTTTNFDPSNSTSYTDSTSTTVYDSLGESHVISYYFVKENTNQWQAFSYLDGLPVDVNGGNAITHPDPSGSPTVTQNALQLNFNADGSLDTTALLTPIVTDIALSNGADPLSLTHDFSSNGATTQYAADFSVNILDPDGYTTGRLTGINFADDGTIRASYTNGISTALGKIALADFPNQQGLINVGGSSWLETIESGAVLAGEGGSGRFGLIQSGALETSNVDLTQQLVNLITAQRNFQANARTIETANTLTQTIIQIR